MNETYIVIELQKNNGQLANLITEFQDESQAYSAFHLAAASAAISQVKKHSILLLTDNGGIMSSTSFLHGEDTTSEKFLVIEYQINENQCEKIVTAHDTIIEADNKFNNVVACAAISNVRKHLVMILSEDGAIIKSILFEHVTLDEPLQG